MAGPSRPELLEPRERGFRREAARVPLVVPCTRVGRETELLDQERQRQSLTDERDQDDGESDEQDEPARRKVERQRERRGQCDHATQTRPTDEEHGAPWRRRIRPTHGRDESREVGRREYPDNA